MTVSLLATFTFGSGHLDGSNTTLGCTYPNLNEMAESWINWGDPGQILDSCQFNICKVGTPTNVCAKLYSSSADWESWNVIPDTLLATSDPLDVSTILTTYSTMTFTFSGTDRVVLDGWGSDASNYFIAIHCDYNPSNVDYIRIQYNGHEYNYGGSAATGPGPPWTPNMYIDIPFAVYAAAAPAVNAGDAEFTPFYGDSANYLLTGPLVTGTGSFRSFSDDTTIVKATPNHCGRGFSEIEPFLGSSKAGIVVRNSKFYTFTGKGLTHRNHFGNETDSLSAFTGEAMSVRSRTCEQAAYIQPFIGQGNGFINHQIAGSAIFHPFTQISGNVGYTSTTNYDDVLRYRECYAGI